MAEEESQQSESDPRRSILLGAEHPDEEDEDEDMPLVDAQSSQLQPTASSPTTAATAASSYGAHTRTGAKQQPLLPTRILPSPLVQHNSGPTALRFHSALSRVQSDPTRDTEAWQALLTEVQVCYAGIQSASASGGGGIHATDADTLRKLDWVESIYGTLLHRFPYSSYCATVANMLFKQSARLGEEHGPSFGRPEPTRRMLEAQAKLEHLLELRLGVSFQNNSNDATTNSSSSSTTITTNNDKNAAMLVWMVELWQVYIQTVLRTAARQAEAMAPDDRPAYIQKQGLQAYQTAAPYAGHVHHNDVFWNQFISFVAQPQSSLLLPQQQPQPQPLDPNMSMSPSQIVQVRAVFQELLVIPMKGLDTMWTQYEVWERTQSAALAQALTQEYLPKYQHARSVYIERLKIYQEADLQLGRLATEPAGSSNDDDATTAAGANADDNKNNNSISAKQQQSLADEYKLLQVWNKRLGYERTNPCRYTASELPTKIRTLYKLQASVLMRHPEAWHSWSMWEADNFQRRRNVLQLAQAHLPDCTLLAYSEAQLLLSSSYSSSSSPSSSSSTNTTDQPPPPPPHKEAYAVMEAFLERSPNTAAFVLYQQMVRQHDGIQAARKVFSRARRVLQKKKKSQSNAVDEKDDENTPSTAAGGGMSDSSMVMNRHENGEAAVATTAAAAGTTGIATTGATADGSVVNNNNNNNGDSNNSKVGYITWHLYAAHAHMEHRTNKEPQIARKIFQLGLEHDASFLTSPRYCQMYAQVLLELDDMPNLQSLLTRAVAATADDPDALQALWDLNIQVSTATAACGMKDNNNSGDSSNDNNNNANNNIIAQLERQRWAALHGTTHDVATGGLLGQDSLVVGAQKISIHDQLIRLEGFDTSSAIVNGLQRQVDLLELQGFWGRGTLQRRGNSSNNNNNSMAAMESDWSAGGASDVSFCRRLEYQRLEQQGLTSSLLASSNYANATAMDHRRGGPGGAAAIPGLPAASTMMMAIQSMPEWLRPLCLLLPATRLRVAVVPKPPPHLVEQALGALKLNGLPAERPADSNNKRKNGEGDDDSDDDGPRGSGGYGSQFRARQRARMNT